MHRSVAATDIGRGRFDPVERGAQRLKIRGRFDPVERGAQRLGK